MRAPVALGPGSVLRRAAFPGSPAMPRRLALAAACLCLVAALAPRIAAAPPDGNRLADLDEVNPYYPHRNSPRLTTPQWVGEPGVEAVVVLAIDDMRDPAVYEK